MSASNLIKLTFSLSYPDLVSTATTKIAFLRRDQTDLAARGITTGVIDIFEALNNTFIAIPSNKSEKADASLGFQDRDEQATILRVAIREVRNIAQNTFGKKSTIYKSFDIKGLYTLSPNELYIQSGNIVVRGTNNIAAMGPKGLTTAMLTNITTQAATLSTLISATPILVSDAETVTGDRRTTANSLYAMMTNLCGTAKTYYIDRDKLKAENYVIYDPASAVVDRSGIMKAKKYGTRKTDGIVAETQFRLKVKEGTSLQFYFAMTRNSLPGPLVPTVNFNPNIFFETTAAGLGYDAAAGITIFIIRNPNDDDAEFLAKIG